MPRKRRPGRPAYPDLLTPAEWRVAEGVRHGQTNRAIAARMNVSLDAVKFHVGNILSKLGFQRRTQLRKWPGVRADSNLGRKKMNLENELSIGAIGQISRRASNVEKTARWFQDTIGLRHLYTFGELAFFDCAGTRLMLCKGDPAQNAILYFSVPDLRAAHRMMESKGVTFFAAPHLIHRHDDGTEEWMAFFNDPDGQPLAIMSRVPSKTAAERISGP